MRRSPYAAFAGLFVVTLLSLTAVGAVLPVIPRFVRGPLDSGNLAVGIAIVVPLVVVSIEYEMPWWVHWLAAPAGLFALIYAWVRIRFRLAGLDPETGEEKNRGAQI